MIIAIVEIEQKTIDSSSRSSSSRWYTIISARSDQGSIIRMRHTSEKVKSSAL